MGRMELNNKIKEALKDSKQARKNANKAEKIARKAKGKAEKLESKAVAVDRVLKNAKCRTDDAMAEIDQAKNAHARAMRWTAAIGQGAREARRVASEAVADANRIHGKAEYCDHSVSRV